MLRNPLYFITLLLLAVAAYVTYTLNLWGPMINMANAASVQALEEAKKWLREFLEASDSRGGGGGRGRDQDYEMERLDGMGRGRGGGRQKMDAAGSGGEGEEGDGDGEGI